MQEALRCVARNDSKALAGIRDIASWKEQDQSKLIYEAATQLKPKALTVDVVASSLPVFAKPSCLASLHPEWSVCQLGAIANGSVG